jgi:hypothetical protein
MVLNRDGKVEDDVVVPNSTYRYKPPWQVIFVASVAVRLPNRGYLEELGCNEVNS